MQWSRIRGPLMDRVMWQGGMYAIWAQSDRSTRNQISYGYYRQTYE